VRFAEATLLAQEAPLGACNSRWHSLPGRGFEKLEQVEPAGKADFRWRRRRVQSQPGHYAARPLPTDKGTQSVADQPVSASERRHDDVSIHARMGGWHERVPAPARSEARLQWLGAHTPGDTDGHTLASTACSPDTEDTQSHVADPVDWPPISRRCCSCPGLPPLLFLAMISSCVSESLR